MNHTCRLPFSVMLMKDVLGDDMHKFNSFIFVKPSALHSASVQPFGASWTTTNLNDRISIGWLKFTKAQSEMKMIMQEYKVARINAGFPKLKHYETDNVQATTCCLLLL